MKREAGLMSAILLELIDHHYVIYFDQSAIISCSDRLLTTRSVRIDVQDSTRHQYIS